MASNDEIFVEHWQSDIETLPKFTEIDIIPTSNYNNVPPEEFVSNINTIYKEMVK